MWGAMKNIEARVGYKWERIGGLCFYCVKSNNGMSLLKDCMGDLLFWMAVNWGLSVL